MGRFDKLREEKGGLAQRFNFSISCNKKEKVAPCKKGTLKVANLARSTFSILLNDQKLHSPLKNWTWHCHRPGPGSLRRWIGLWRDGGWGWCYVWVGCRWCLGWWWCWLASSLLPRSAKRLQPAHGLRSVAPPPGLRVSGREWCEWVSEGQLADIPRLPLFSTVTETGPAPRQGDIWAKQPARLADAEGTLRSRTMPKLYQKISSRVKVESWRVEGLFGILRFITCQVQCCYFTENTASLSSRYILLLNAMLASAFFDWRQSLSSDSCLQSGLVIRRVATFFWSAWNLLRGSDSDLEVENFCFSKQLEVEPQFYILAPFHHEPAWWTQHNTMYTEYYTI